MNNKIRVFATAIESYLDSSIAPVAYAENDAQNFVKAWQSLGAIATDCIVLLSKQATCASIRSKLKTFLFDVEANDTLIFFYAGHGAAFNDESYITAHDTTSGDIKDTSISLAEVLNVLKKSKCKRILLFIDACHSGLPISQGMRSITSNFTKDEMKKFCRNSEFYIAFASCKVDEYSWSNQTLKHGIWTYCIIEALTGKDKNALEKGVLVTGDSLRNYLSDAVPRLLRTSRSGNEIQTPCTFGNSTKEFIIADLGPIIAARARHTLAPNPIVKDSIVEGIEIGSIRSLTGFKRHSHRVPNEKNNATQNFVSDVGSEDLKTKASKIHELIRREFAFKRKDINYVNDFGVYSIKTPDFDVNVRIEQHAEGPENYCIVTQVTSFRRPEVVIEEAFSNVFSEYCDTLVIEFSKEVNVSKLIDTIEDIPALDGNLSYELDNSSLTLALNTPRIKMKISQYDLRITASRFGNFKQLISNTAIALKTLNSEEIQLNLSIQ